jgi:hypothetical protein
MPTVRTLPPVSCRERATARKGWLGASRECRDGKEWIPGDGVKGRYRPAHVTGGE